MSRRSSGQSVVEMAFVLPVLLIVLFGIMEFGFYIYAYSSVSQAARNAAEVAAQLPPYQGWLNYASAGVPGGAIPYRADRCVNAIFAAAESDATLFGGGVNGGRNLASTQFVQISYPNGGQTRNLRDRGPIEVTIRYPVRGITPLFRLLGLEDQITMVVTQRRSIENLGVDPSQPRSIACAKDLDDWNELNSSNNGTGN